MEKKEYFEEFYNFVGSIYNRINGGNPDEILLSYKNGDISLKEAGERLLPYYIKTLAEEVLRIVKYHSLPYDFLMDLLNESIITFMTAIEKFDVNRNVKFSTYLVISVRRKLSRYVVTALQLVRNKKALHTKLEEDEKFEYCRITDESSRYIFYEVFLKGDREKLIDKEKLRNIIDSIGDTSIKNVLLKILNDKKLTAREKKLFQRHKSRIRTFLAERGISSLEDIFLN